MFGKNKDQDPDYELFTVHDIKSRTYGIPFPEKNSQVVLRDFLNAFNDSQAFEKNKYFRNAEDYSVFKVGNYDQRTGEITPIQREHVANLIDIKAMVTPRPNVALNKENSPVALLPT